MQDPDLPTDEEIVHSLVPNWPAYTSDTPIRCKECDENCVPDTDHGCTVHTCSEHGWQATTFDKHGPKV